MRSTVAVILLAACGSAPPRAVAAPQPPAVVPAVPTAPSDNLVTFTQPGDLYMLVVEGAMPRCQHWRVDPEHSQLISIEGPAMRTLTYHTYGSSLFLDAIELTTGDVTSSTTCTSDLHVVEHASSLSVNDARWYRSADDCSEAIARHARVATELPCTLDPESPQLEQATSRRKFERLLAGGGTMYAIVDSPKGELCIPVTFTPHRQRPHKDTLEGELAYPIEGGTEAFDYVLAPRATELTLLGPGRTMDDGSASGFGCAGDTHLEFHADYVMLADVLYFQRSACSAAIRAKQERASWLPLVEGELVADRPSEQGAPAIGGC